MIEIYLHNARIFKKVRPGFFKNAAQKVLCQEDKKDGVLSIIFLRTEKARQLNLRYRKKDYIPEVLSLEGDPEEKEFGQIFLCPSAIKQKAKQKKTSFKKELIFCLIHGLLHLLGYSHQTKKAAKLMETREQKHLKDIFSIK